MSDQPSSNRRRRVLITVGVVVVALVAAGGAFVWWFLRDDAPAAVSIDDAAAQVTDDTDPPDTGAIDTTIADGTGDTTAATPDATADGGTATGIDGDWTVDTSVGEFSFEDSTGTFVGFRVAEELSGIGSTEAVGRTPTVSGTLVVDGLTITEVTIEADMTDITTNDQRRNDRVQSALQTDQFPTATFVLTGPIQLDESALDGEVVAVDATGDLTIHGVTETVTIPLEARLVGDTIVVVGSLEISFGDFGVEVPSAPIVVSAEDHGPLELQLFFTR